MLNNLKKRLVIRYTSPPGKYLACNDMVEDRTTKTFYAYPSGTVEATPWETRYPPYLTWKNTGSRTLHTLIIVDVGLGTIHGLWVDIEGNTLEKSKELVPYKQPFNFRPMSTPYAFLLFKQTGKSTANIKDIKKLPKSILKRFVDKAKLIGPVAMNWIMVSFDKYAAQIGLDMGFVNNCPYFVSKAAERIEQDPFRGFLPANRTDGFSKRIHNNTTDGI